MPTSILKTNLTFVAKKMLTYVAVRGEHLQGVTKMGANDGGINILRSPTWSVIKNAHLDIKVTDPARYWEIVTDEFWNTANKPWLDEAIARDDALRFVSDPTDELAVYVTDEDGKYVMKNGERIRSIFGREVDYLKANGYAFRADGTAVKVRQ